MTTENSNKVYCERKKHVISMKILDCIERCEYYMNAHIQALNNPNPHIFRDDTWLRDKIEIRKAALKRLWERYYRI